LYDRVDNNISQTNELYNVIWWIYVNIVDR